MEYVHTPLDEAVEFVAGSYAIESENMLPYGDREILYLTGSTSQICGCCGNSCDGMRFITVAGFIRAWQSRRNEQGLFVSDIEPVADENARLEVRRTLEQEHGVSSVQFL